MEPPSVTEARAPRRAGDPRPRPRPRRPRRAAGADRRGRRRRSTSWRTGSTHGRRSPPRPGVPAPTRLAGARSPTAARDGRATTSARSPAGPARGASTSRCTATATRSRPSSRCGRPTRVRRASHGGIVAGLFDDVFGFVLDVVQEAGVHRRADDPLRAPDAAAPPARLPRPARPARGPQAAHRGRARRRHDRGSAGRRPRPRRCSSPSTPAIFAAQTAKLPAPPDEDPPVLNSFRARAEYGPFQNGCRTRSALEVGDRRRR